MCVCVCVCVCVSDFLSYFKKKKKKVSCFKGNSQDAKALKSYILEFLFKLIKSKKQNPKLLLFQEESRNIPKENARLHSYSMKI